MGPAGQPKPSARGAGRQCHWTSLGHGCVFSPAPSCIEANPLGPMVTSALQLTPWNTNLLPSHPLAAGVYIPLLPDREVLVCGLGTVIQP